jgi:hypothetical protein
MAMQIRAAAAIRQNPCRTAPEWREAVIYAGSMAPAPKRCAAAGALAAFSLPQTVEKTEKSALNHFAIASFAL